MARKRSQGVGRRSSLAPKKITGAQRKARKVNIKKAQAAKKKGGGAADAAKLLKKKKAAAKRKKARAFHKEMMSTHIGSIGIGIFQ